MTGRNGSDRTASSARRSPAAEGPAPGAAPAPAPSTIPAIAPVAATDTPRPFWSVMIPTYRCSDLLEGVLRSVLDQDPGPDAMEIVVVDDVSPDGRSEEIVARLAPGRIRFIRNETNLGLAGNWNQCIRLSRGRWIHILHQDDLILPGFYERLAQADRDAPGAGAAFCQHIHINGDGRWLMLSHLERRTPGLLDDWLETIINDQRIECASIVVKREVYEQLGGYTNELVFALDWEMWVRIAAHYPVWFEPTMLACYRMHSGSETTRLKSRGRAFSDTEKAFGVVKRYLPRVAHDKVGLGLRPKIRTELVRESCEHLTEGDYRAGLARLRDACRYDPSFRFTRIRYDFTRWAAVLWIREHLHGKSRAPK